MEVKFKTKFGWEDQVYYVYKISTFKEVTCPKCAGLVDKKYRCPECCNLGYIEKYETTYIVSELCTIHFISITLYKEEPREIRIVYHLKPLSTDFKMFEEKFVFADREEAQARCDELNKLEKGKNEN